jgi:hypothetical protein
MDLSGRIMWPVGAATSTVARVSRDASRNVSRETSWQAPHSSRLVWRKHLGGMSIVDAG